MQGLYSFFTIRNKNCKNGKNGKNSKNGKNGKNGKNSKNSKIIIDVPKLTQKLRVLQI